MIGRRGSKVAVSLAMLTLLLSLLLAATALADGKRTLELDSLTGMPEAGMPNTLIVRFLEGDHGVKDAKVTIIGGMGGSHDEHMMGSGPAGGAAPFEALASEGEPGEYSAQVVFSQPGTWTVWVSAEKAGKLTEKSFEVPVTEARAAAEEPGVEEGAGAAPSVGQGTTADEIPTAEDGLAADEPVLDEHGAMSDEEMAGHGGAVLGEEGDSHADEGEEAGHGGASGGINWYVIAAFLAVIGLATLAAAVLKKRLRGQIALGNLRNAGVSGE